MAVYLTILFPVIVLACRLLVELMRLRKYFDALPAVVMVLSAIFFTLSTSNIIIGGSELFAYSRVVSAMAAMLILPSALMVGRGSAGYRYSVKQKVGIYAPALLIILVAAVMPAGSPHTERMMELVMMAQGIAAMIKSWYDYSHIDDADHRTDTVNSLIIRLGYLGFAFFMISAIGIANWATNREFAIVCFCYFSYCVSSHLHLTRKSFSEEHYMFEESNEFGFSAADDTILTEPEKEEEEQKTPNPPIDFAVAPEIPRQEAAASEENAMQNAADELEQIMRQPEVDVLAMELRALIEKEKIYLRAGIRIDEVALILGTNRTYLAKKMKEVYGHTFAEYMNMCRLRSARTDMLQRHNTSIETIALENGFNSSNTFIKVFNQFYGISPAAWRKQNM